MTAPGSDPKPISVAPIKVLLVDDEERYRASLAQRLALRGFDVRDVPDGEEAMRQVRHNPPDVVLLDRKMPGMDGEAVLKELKRLAPEIQVVMLTGQASIESATETGRLDAFAYLEKPCATDELVWTLESAYREKGYAMARHEIPALEPARTRGAWLEGAHGWRPGVMLLGAAIFAALVMMPAPDSLLGLVGAPKQGELTDPIAGYADFRRMKPGETIAEYYGRANGLERTEVAPDGARHEVSLTVQQTARRAQVMLGVLVVAALFWATGALPIGITALLVGVLMYVFGIFSADGVAKAYAKDAVIFIMGVLAFAVGIAKTGLDRRIGLVLLGTSKSIPLFLFVFLPLLAVTASFLSEHALVAFIAPILMVVYMAAVRAAGLAKDRSLAVLFILGLCFAANQGGPGSPAAGGRNAVMIGILADYGIAPSFGEWVQYGMPFVPVMALVIGAYFFLTVRRKLAVKKLDIAALVRRESEKLGRMTTKEILTGLTLVLVIGLWVMGDEEGGGLGMGGPVLIGLVMLAVFRVITWRDINRISWDVVALYASACAMGAGLAKTGAALWIAQSFVALLPESMSSGEGLAVASSLFTGILTNFMSDGATVSAIGPITVPMATISGTSPWMVGLATAFASSFANALIIGTPNNAIAYALAKDANSGEQLVTLGDFMRHGVVVTLLALVVLWVWAIFGYWQWIGF